MHYQELEKFKGLNMKVNKNKAVVTKLEMCLEWILTIKKSTSIQKGLQLELGKVNE